MFFPPLVAPIEDVGQAERERTQRQVRLPQVGAAGQARLAAARVLVMGAGGLGAPILQYLAAAGVGSITVVDDDVITSSNLHRQILFGSADVGRPKTEVASERLVQTAPDLQLHQVRQRLTGTNAGNILAGHHLVIDGTDTFDTRYIVADACDELGIPLIWGSVLRFDAQATVFWSRPPAGEPVRMRDIFPSAPTDAPSCAEAGVMGAVCGQLGSLLTMEAIKLICGIGRPLLGRMAVIDALAATTREVPLLPDLQEDRIPVVTRRDAQEQALLLVDVRSPEEVTSGVLPGAYHLPIDTILANPDAAAQDLAREVTQASSAGVAIYCHAGPRARSAAHMLMAAQAQFHIFVLAGGYADHV